MKKRYKLVFWTLIFTLVYSPAHALRCGNKLVNVGDRKHKVLHVCGEPLYRDAYDRPVAVYGYSHHYRSVDVWTYNFGKKRFMRELIFEDGILRRINELDYGY